MELAWNTQKNKMSDVKGKEMEQERKGKISNPDIDLERTNLNFDFVDDKRTLYQRVKSRVDDLKESGSRVQKNSVVMYSNVITVPQFEFQRWGVEKTNKYFQACYEFFCNEFGAENVVSAKVHYDETAPHMHLHFVPVNKENGRLQARVVMNREKINYIHDKLPDFLLDYDFYVTRGKGKTVQNIEDIHEYKKVMDIIDQQKSRLDELVQEMDKTAANVIQEKRQLKNLKEINATLYDVLSVVKTEVADSKQEYMKSRMDNIVAKDEINKVANKILNSNKVMFSESLKVDGNLVRQLVDLVKDLYDRFKEIYNKQVELFKENRELRKENKLLKTELNQKQNLDRDLDKEVQERAEVITKVAKMDMEKTIKEKTYEHEEKYEELYKNYHGLYRAYVDFKKENKSLKETVKFLEKRVDIVLRHFAKEDLQAVLNSVNRIEQNAIKNKQQSRERDEGYGRSM